MEVDDDPRQMGFGSSAAFQSPALVSLSPLPPSISSSPRRLSGYFIPPSEPVPAKRQLAWISLQGRLVGAEEATSARAIGGGLGPKESVAWDLFTPIQRVMVIAIIAIAAANSKKNKQILQLKKSVEFRDQVLSAMQQELDNLCKQVNHFKGQPNDVCDISSAKNVNFQAKNSFLESIDYVGCGCRPCEYHQPPFNDVMGTAVREASNFEENLKYLPSPMNDAEPEERRMSSLSDWAPSVTSSIDIQLQLDNEHEIYNLRKECDEKNTIIKELSSSLHSSEVVNSKRIADLEDIIRRKKMIIRKFKKDMLILEQKVLHLTRLERQPSKLSSSSGSGRQLPVMAYNLLYDLGNTTSPSSSDSDCTPRNGPQACAPKHQKPRTQNSCFSSVENKKMGNVRTSSAFRKSADQHQRPPRASRRLSVESSNSCSSMGNQKVGSAKTSSVPIKSTDRQQRTRPVSPLKEKSLNQNPSSASFSRTKQSLSAGENLRTRRRNSVRSTEANPQKN